MSSSTMEENHVSKLRQSFVKKIIKNREIVQFSLTVVGHSMWPFIRSGQMVMMRRIGRNERIPIGSVIAIRKKNGILVHRVLWVARKGRSWFYFTKGDRRLVGDGWVDGRDVIATISCKSVSERLIDLGAALYSAGLLVVGKIARRS